MIVRQFLHAVPVAISYLFGCGGKASAAVVDPVGDIELYRAAADAAGMRILYVIDTHLHADHLSTAGNRLLQCAFHLGQLDPEAAQLDLAVAAAHEDQIAVGAGTGQITGQIHPAVFPVGRLDDREAGRGRGVGDRRG